MNQSVQRALPPNPFLIRTFFSITPFFQPHFFFNPTPFSLTNQSVIYKMTRFGFDTFGRDLLGDKNIQQFVDECFKADPWIETAVSLPSS
jgi:hypothetical protein